jgi:hypothetical protein
MAAKINIDESVTAFIPEKELRSQAAEFYRMSGGKGVTTIDDFIKDSDRPYANKDRRVVNIGSSKKKALVFHEMAHHIEFENPEVGKAAREWLLSRATGKIAKLKDITGNQGYSDKELAVPDKFVTPYVGKVVWLTKDKDGKVIPRNVTEVVSMGMEGMSDPESMAKLYLSDPEHFKFVLGVMRHG